MADRLPKDNLESTAASGDRSANAADLALAPIPPPSAKRQKIRESGVEDEDSQTAFSEVGSFFPVPRSKAPAPSPPPDQGSSEVYHPNSTGREKRVRRRSDSDSSDVEIIAVRPRQDRPRASFTSQCRSNNINQSLSSEVGPFVSLTNAYPTTPLRPAANTGSAALTTPGQDVLHSTGSPVTPSRITPQQRAAGEWVPLDSKEETLVIYLLLHDISIMATGRAVSEMRQMGKFAVNNGAVSVGQFVDELRRRKTYTLEEAISFVRNVARQIVDEGWSIYRRRAKDWDEQGDVTATRGTARDRAAERRALETFRRNWGRDPAAGERQYETFRREQEDEQARGYADGDFEGLQNFLLGRIERYLRVKN